MLVIYSDWMVTITNRAERSRAKVIAASLIGQEIKIKQIRFR